MYRPTVRYDDVFKEYVDAVFGATDLDRNQIIRAALFVAAHTPEFRSLLQSYREGDKNIPVPPWSKQDDHYWKGGPAPEPPTPKTIVRVSKPKIKYI